MGSDPLGRSVRCCNRSSLTGRPLVEPACRYAHRLVHPRRHSSQMSCCQPPRPPDSLQCITIHAAFRAIKGRIILAAIAAFGLGEGLTNTHVTSKLAEGVVSIGQSLGPIPLLFLVYLRSVELTASCRF
eukprot:767669-Hanusia_phi.AAC.5